MAAAGPGMAEKKEGESSDSEAYLSADEGLASSRGGTKEVALGRLVALATAKLSVVARVAYQRVILTQLAHHRY